MERNHPVRVGDIFERSHTDEDGHTTSFYEVVRLKGKTMVELRAIGMEYSIDDERCRQNPTYCRVYPLPGRFYSDNPKGLIVAKVRLKEDRSQRYWLSLDEWGGELRWRKSFYPYNPEDAYYNTGYWGGCDRGRLGLDKKQEE